MSATQRLIETSKAVMRKYAVEAHTCIVLRQFEDALAAAKEEQDKADHECPEWAKAGIASLDLGLELDEQGKVLTDKEIERAAHELYPDTEGPVGKGRAVVREYVRTALRYARDNGYLAPAKEEAERKADPVAWMRRWYFDGNEGTRGNRPPGWKFKEITTGKFLDDDIPLYLAPAKGSGLDVEQVMEAVADWVDGEMDNMPTSGLTCARGSRQFQEAMGELRKALEDLAGKGDTMNVRGAVRWFAEQMEAALLRNDHKGGWTGMAEEALLHRVRDEVEEVRQALSILRNRQSPATKGVATAEDFREVIRECADVANMAMMIADNLGPQIGQSGEPAKGSDPWISVEDRLPEVGAKVLTYSPVDGCEMMVEELEDAANPESWEASLGVTHWMPLPAPPDNTGK